MSVSVLRHSELHLQSSAALRESGPGFTNREVLSMNSCGVRKPLKRPLCHKMFEKYEVVSRSVAIYANTVAGIIHQSPKVRMHGHIHRLVCATQCHQYLVHTDNVTCESV